MDVGASGDPQAGERRCGAVDAQSCAVEIARRLGRGDPGPPAHGLLVWVAEDPDAFWEQLAPHALHENNSYGRWYTEYGAWNGYETAVDTDELKKARRYRILTPDQLIERARRLAPTDEITLHPMVGGFDPDLAWQSLRLLESKVLPALRS